jgi:hypothetical protein
MWVQNNLFTRLFSRSWLVRSLLPGGPPKDQMLFATAPNTHALSSDFMNAADGPEPHLLTPTAEFVAVG